MKSYCPQCGGATVYSGAKPKFCSSCGNALSVLAQTEKQKNYVIHEDIDIEQDPSEQVNLGNINKLDIEIEPEKGTQVTLGSLMESMENIPAPEGNMKFPRINTPKQNPKEVMKQFKKEAGTLRNKNA